MPSSRHTRTSRQAARPGQEARQGAREVHVLMNNYRANYAVRNARGSQSLLGQPVVPEGGEASSDQARLF